MEFDEETIQVLEIYIQSKEWIISRRHLLCRNPNQENVCQNSSRRFISQRAEASLHLASIAVISPQVCNSTMDGYSGDEFSSEGEFNSNVNSIIDPNDIVLKDGSDGEKGNLTKGPWGPEEDKWLINFVTINGEEKWRRVATELERTPKSCRLRWCNQLNPKINHRPFTPAEDKIIVSMIKKGGRNGKWSVIAKILEFRTDNQVKNRWNSKLRKQYGNLRKKNPSRKQSANVARRNVKGRHSSTSNSISPPSPTLASTSPCRVSPPRLANASVNPYLPPAFVVSTPSLCPAPTFNRLTSLSLCPPGHETDDVLNPGIVINPSGLCPLPSQQYAPLGNYTALVQEAIAIEPEQQDCASDMNEFRQLE